LSQIEAEFEFYLRPLGI